MHVLAEDYKFYVYINGHLITSRSLSTSTSWGNDDTNTPVYLSSPWYNTATVNLKNIYYTNRMGTTCAPTPVPTENKVCARRVGAGRVGTGRVGAGGLRKSRDVEGV